MRTRKGIKYKTRNKRGNGNTRKGNTRKGKHNGRHRRKRTFKIRGGATSGATSGNVSALGTLGSGASTAAKSLARTTSKAMNLVTETAERSVEIAGASVNLGLNITHGTVDTTNLAFLTVNTVLQRCLNFVRRRFDESYTQISQCEDRKYASGGECLKSCINPIITKFAKDFNYNRPKEYGNLRASIENTHKLIDKSISYFCRPGRFYGKVCSDEYSKYKEETRLLLATLMINIKDEERKEKNYEFNTRTRILNGLSCTTTIELCKSYIDMLCIPCQQLGKITDDIKKQEELLLSWNKKIEEAKEKAELEIFLKTIDAGLDQIEKERQITQKKEEQEQKKNAKKTQIDGILKKNVEIEMYEREIILIEQSDDIQASITMSSKIVIGLESYIGRLEKSIKNGNETGSLNQKLQTYNLRLDNERKVIEELKRKQAQIKQILDRENANLSGVSIGVPGLVERLKENITKIETNQKEKETALAEAAATEAAETEAAETEAAAKAKPLSENNATSALERAANEATAEPLSYENTTKTLERAANAAKAANTAKAAKAANTAKAVNSAKPL